MFINLGRDCQAVVHMCTRYSGENKTPTIGSLLAKWSRCRFQAILHQGICLLAKRQCVGWTIEDVDHIHEYMTLFFQWVVKLRQKGYLVAGYSDPLVLQVPKRLCDRNPLTGEKGRSIGREIGIRMFSGIRHVTWNRKSLLFYSLTLAGSRKMFISFPLHFNETSRRSLHVDLFCRDAEVHRPIPFPDFSAQEMRGLEIRWKQNLEKRRREEEEVTGRRLLWGEKRWQALMRQLLGG